MEGGVVKKIFEIKMDGRRRKAMNKTEMAGRC
jgi:hypothetical protein